MSALEAARELRRRRLSDARRVLEEGILVLARRDGLAVTEAMAKERVNNILFVLLEEGLLR